MGFFDTNIFKLSATIVLVLLAIVLVLGLLIKGERFVMVQEATGKTKVVKRGFSFTYVFFGAWVPLLRGHIAGFFLSLFLTIFSFGIGHFVLCFIYNGIYINFLVASGFKRIDQNNASGVSVQINMGEGNHTQGGDAIQTNMLTQVDGAASGFRAEVKNLHSKVVDMAKTVDIPKRLESLISEPKQGQPIPSLASSRYYNPNQTVLVENDKDYWLAGMPALIKQIQIVQIPEQQGAFLNLCVQNLSEKRMVALYVDVLCSNVLKQEMEGLKDVAFLDLKIEQAKCFFTTTSIPLKDATIRRCTVVVRHIAFEDESIWSNDDALPTQPLEELSPLKLDPELREDYILMMKTHNSNAASYHYQPTQMGETWYCACGQFNTGETCIACGVQKDLLWSMLEIEKIVTHRTERLERLRLEQEARDAEYQRRQEEQRRLEQERAQERQRKMELAKSEAVAAFGSIKTAVGGVGKKIAATVENVKIPTKEQQPTPPPQQGSTHFAAAPQPQPPVQDAPVQRLFCPNCGFKNEPSATFCAECGTPIATGVL